MSFNSCLHLSKMENMLVVFFFGTLLFYSGESQNTQQWQLYNFNAVDQCKTNKPGSMNFKNELGIGFMANTMKEATAVIWKVFQQENIDDRKYRVKTNFLMNVVDDIPGKGGYYFRNETDKTETIVVSADFMANFPKETLRDVVKEVVYHEMTHVWQWYGDEQSPSPPSMLFEGIADYVPLAAGFKADRKPGGGTKWNEGYEVTAFFLQYCNSLKPGFVAQLNKKMRTNYSETYFQELLGKPVQELWKDYKNKYANGNQAGRKLGEAQKRESNFDFMTTI